MHCDAFHGKPSRKDLGLREAENKKTGSGNSGELKDWFSTSLPSSPL